VSLSTHGTIRVGVLQKMSQNSNLSSFYLSSFQKQTKKKKQLKFYNDEIVWIIAWYQKSSSSISDKQKETKFFYNHVTAFYKHEIFEATQQDTKQKIHYCT